MAPGGFSENQDSVSLVHSHPGSRLRNDLLGQRAGSNHAVHTDGPTPKDSTPTAGASGAGAAASAEGQSFSGTVEKQGDKYVLKDDAGKTYDIDHQDDVKKFEGKRVRVKGTLDASGTKIMVK